MESDLHKRAKQFVADTLRAHGLSATTEARKWRMLDNHLMMWTFDVWAMNGKRSFDIEIDGHVGHGKLRQRRDAVRDAFFEKEGYEVFRFPLKFFVGKKRMTESELLKELKLA